MAPDDKTGGNNGTVGIIAIFQLRGAVAVRFYRRLRRYLDLSPDWIASAAFRRHDTQMPYNMNSVPPFGVPQFISLSFWGGVWGIIFVVIEPYLVRSPDGYWLGAIIFGAIFPTAVAWFIVRPAKGLPVADVFRVPGIFIGPIVNGLWGLGTALFLSWMPGSAARAQ